jgi:hypothetical protein
MLATNLHGSDLISTELLHNIMILSDTLNRAVHGERLVFNGHSRAWKQEGLF